MCGNFKIKNSVNSNFEVLFAIKYSFSVVCVLGKVHHDHQKSTSSQKGYINTIVKSKRPCSFQLLSQTKEEEDAFDFVHEREDVVTNDLVSSVANMVKGSLGAGLLSSHVAYMKAGIAVAIPLTFVVGIFIGYCMHLLVQSAQILYKRTTVPSMSYADVGEAAVCLFPNPKISRYSKVLRYYIDITLTLALFGTCACYQLVLAKSMKQIVDDTFPSEEETDSVDLRIYLIGMIFPFILISLIRHLKYLAPFAIVADVIIVCCMSMAVYYAVTNNPRFENLETSGELWDFFESTGMLVFAMSCAPIIMPIENNMRNPRKFSLLLSIGMGIIIFCTFTMAFFGYSAFLDESDAPITVNFPMELVPEIIKGLVAFMLFVSHGLSFWVLFSVGWVYIKEYHDKRSRLLWEYVYRVFFVIVVTVLALAFPNIKSLMGLIGALCTTTLVFILPNIIYLLVIWHRPGFGKYNWRLWKTIILMAIGFIVCVVGTFINGRALITTLIRETSDWISYQLHS